jgi:hypothetical protein
MVTYEIYLATDSIPKLEFQDHPDTYYSPQNNFEDNTTYYWRIQPNASGIFGPPSEIWSFTVEISDHIPKFDIKLVLYPPEVNIKQTETKYIKAIVTNLGEVDDRVVLKILEHNIEGLEVKIVELKIKNVITNGIIEFDISVKALENASKGVKQITVIAASAKAAENKIILEERAALTINITGVDKPQGTDKSSNIANHWIFLIFIIIIIIIIVEIIIIKRKKRTKDELSAIETETVKPMKPPTPGKAEKIVTSAPTIIQISGKTTPGDSQQLTPLIIPKPTLVSPKTPGHVPVARQIPEAQQKPQLPPAQTQPPVTEPTETPEMSTETPAQIPTPTLSTETTSLSVQPTIATQPTPTLTQPIPTPTIQTPSIQQEPSTGQTPSELPTPSVHLPGEPTQTAPAPTPKAAPGNTPDKQ